MNDDIKVITPTDRQGFSLFLKRFIQFLFFCLVLPRILKCYIEQWIFGSRAFISASESIAKKSGIWGVFTRQAFYGSLLSSCGKDVSIGWGTVFSMREASLGDRAYLGRNCNIGFGRIGSNVMLADNVVVLSGGREHSMEHSGRSMHDQQQIFRRVTIGDGSWIGVGAIIMEDVGRDCIVGAGAVVNKGIPDGAIAVGVPAKVIKFRPGYGP